MKMALYLVKTVKLVQIDGVVIRHNHAVEDDGHASLLAKSRRTDLAGFTQHDGSIGNKDVLVIVGVDGIGDNHLHRANSTAVQPVHQNRIHRRSFINEIGLTHGGVDIDFGAVLNGSLTGWYRRHNQVAVALA